MQKDERELAFLTENLRKIEFLSHLNLEKLQELAKSLVKITFDPGDYLLKEGRSGGAFFILTSGTLSVWAINNEKEEVKVGELQPFTYFGEMALLTKSERYASVRAEGDVIVYMLGKDDFNSIILSIKDARDAIEKMADERKVETARILFPERELEMAQTKESSFFSRLIGK